MDQIHFLANLLRVEGWIATAHWADDARSQRIVHLPQFFGTHFGHVEIGDRNRLVGAWIQAARSYTWLVWEASAQIPGGHHPILKPP